MFLSRAAVCALAVAMVLSAEDMTNESVLKLVKAGMSEEVILGMVTAQPGKYAVTTDDVIALKQAGVRTESLRR